MSGDQPMLIPDVILERYRLGELPSDETARIERLLQEDPALRRRLDALEASDGEIRRRYPPGWLAERIRERMGAARAQTPRPRLASPRRWPLPAALAAAAVLALVLVPHRSGPPAGAPDVASASAAPSDRVKGLEPALTLYRRTADGSETLADGSVARQGDQIRIGYRAAGYAYGVIVSVDGRGSVSVHLGAADGRAAPLRSGDTILLDRSFELDDAPLWERFYFVVAEQPFALAPIVAAARRAAREARSGSTPRLSLPSQYTQFVISLVKEVR